MSTEAGFDHRLLADGRPLDCRVRRAETFLQRGRGLLWHAPLRAGQALWIPRCPSVHTVGMTYPIDVVFLDAHDRVLRVAAQVPPLRMRMCRGAVSTVELRAAQAAALGLQPGQQLSTTAAPACPDTPAA